MLKFEVVPNLDFSHIDWLDEDGFIKPMSCSEIEEEHDVVRLWAQSNSRYQLVTIELVEWLREMIGDRFAIEIGAGMGDLGHLLGIKMTDSYMQVSDPLVMEYYKLLGQPVIQPPSIVENMNGDEAVRHYQPEVVVASWVTQFVGEEATVWNSRGGNY